MGHKNQKGTVSITQYNGRIRLRWRKDCKRYSINLHAYTELTLIQAKRVALQIEQDIILGTFDQSLIKYTGKESKQVLPRMNFCYCSYLTNEFKVILPINTSKYTSHLKLFYIQLYERILDRVIRFQ